MKWTIVLAALLGANLAMIENNQNEASTSESASATGKGEGSVDNTDDTQGQFVTAGGTDTTTKTSTSAPDGTASAAASADISQKPNPTRTLTPIIGTVDVSALPNTPTPTPDTTTSTTTPATPPPTVDKCDICKNPDFMGFGFKPGKCGCCPWPCCCKCIQMEGEQGPCTALLDLAFIMDDSGSISVNDWGVAKQFFNDVVGNFSDIGGNQHVASITFSSNATLNWNLDDPETASPGALSAAIKALQRTAGFTNTAEAMEKATNEVFVAPHDNPNAANVAVVMTDGRANFRRAEIAELAAALRRKAQTICIGVTTEIDMDELKTICDESRIFSVVDFSALTTIIKSLQSEICPEPPKSEKCFCCCTPEQFWGSGGARYFSGKW